MTRRESCFRKSRCRKGIRIGDELTVFLYKDSKDRLISTLTEPKLTLGGLAVLKVGQVGKNRRVFGLGT